MNRLMLFLLGVVCYAPAAHGASPLFVRTDGSDTICNGTVNVSATSFVGVNQPCALATLQTAVNTVDAGGTVMVGAGAYGGQTFVNQSVILLGAQAGNDARTRSTTPAQESILNNNTNSLWIQADNVTVDGFTIEGVTSPPFGYAVFLSGLSSGYSFVNNIVQNNIFGVYLNSAAANLNVLALNLFQTNNQIGGANGNGIYADQGTRHWLISENTFQNNFSCGINLALAPVQDVTISDNLFDGNGGGTCIVGGQNALIQDNLFTNQTASSVVFNGANNGVTLANNVIQNSGVRGIRVRDFYFENPGYGFPPSPNQNITVTGNHLVNNGTGVEIRDGGLSSGFDFYLNRVVDNSVQGINNLSGVTLNAENNWWACNSGPNDATGDCDSFFGPGDFDPWLVLGFSADPGTFAVDQDSQLLADLTQNSDGADTTSLGFIAQDTPAQFAANFGLVNPAATATIDGQAQSVLTPEGFTGSDSVSVTVDHQTLMLFLTVNPAENPIISPNPVPPPTNIFEGTGCALRRDGTTNPSYLLGLLPLAALFFCRGLMPSPSSWASVRRCRRCSH